MKYTVSLRKQQRSLTTTQSRAVMPTPGPVASYELYLPWGLDVWYGLYEEEPYWDEDDDE